jgi:hypothetical protein
MNLAIPWTSYLGPHLMRGHRIHVAFVEMSDGGSRVVVGRVVAARSV